MNPINVPSNGATWLSDASLDTETWLNAVGEEVEWVDTPCFANPFESATDSIAVKHGVELAHSESSGDEIDYRLETTDNVYNHENEFSEIFVWSAYSPEPTVRCRSDWFYADSVYIVVSTHRGGDARCNYGGNRCFVVDSPADAGFFEWCISWHVEIVDASGEVEWSDTEGRFSCGYSQLPTSEVARFIGETLTEAGMIEPDGDDSATRYGVEDAGEWNEGVYVVELKDGRSIRCHPYSPVEYR